MDKKIVFQGERGANSHLACQEAYPDYQPVPCATFEDAFTAIAAGEAELGMIRSKTRWPGGLPISITSCPPPGCTSLRSGFCRSGIS